MKQIKSFVLLLAPIALSGCMAANPARPVLTGGLSSVVGSAVGGDVLKSLGSASGATSMIERTTNNTTTNNDRSSITDRDYSSVTDTSVSGTSVSDTSVSDTSVSDVSSSNTTVGP